MPLPEHSWSLSDGEREFNPQFMTRLVESYVAFGLQVRGSSMVDYLGQGAALELRNASVDSVSPSLPQLESDFTSSITLVQ